MEDDSAQPTPAVRAGRFGGLKKLAVFWPQLPLALVLGLVGVLNILSGLSLPLAVWRNLHTFEGLGGLGQSFSALGGTAQVILGLMLVAAGIGLGWRLVSAWTLAVFLLVITVAVNGVRENWGVGLVLQAVLLGALLWAKPYFTRRTILANLLFSVAGIAAVLAYGVFGSFLLGKDFRPPILDLDTAFYFTVVTLSTVGYGDIVPVTVGARWFVLSLLVTGLGAFASVVASAVGPKISGELNRLFNPRKNTMDPNDHVILVGEGPIARNTADELGRRKVGFIQVVSSKEGVAADKPPDEVVVGEAVDDGVLDQAGIKRARLVIAAREDDGENAFISLVAKDLNPDVRVLAVAGSQGSIRRLKLARADVVFSPAAVGSRLLVDLAEGGEISQAFGDLVDGHSTEV